MKCGKAPNDDDEKLVDKSIITNFRRLFFTSSFLHKLKNYMKRVIKGL